MKDALRKSIPFRLTPAIRIAGIYAVVAAVWIFASDHLLGLLVPDPRIMTEVATYKGLGFVAVTALMLYGLVRHALLNKAPEAIPDDLLPSPRAKWPMLGFAILTAIIVATGSLLIHHQKQAFKREELTKLSTLSQFKVQQMDAWVETGIHQNEYAATRSILARTAQGWLEAGAPQGDTRDILQGRLGDLLQAGQHQFIAMRDRQGTLRLRAGPSGDEERFRETAQKAMDSGHSLVETDVCPDHPPLVHIFTPLGMAKGPVTQVVGCLHLAMNADQKLIPHLESALRETMSAKILLVAYQDGRSTFLNPHLRPPNQTSLMAGLLPSLAPETEPRAISGDHYLGAVAWSRQVPWGIVATEDTEIVFKATQRLTGYVILLGGVFVATGAALLSFWMRLQHRLYTQHQEHQALKTQLLEERLNYLSKFANDIVLLVDEDGRILDANDRACSAYGYPREELLTLMIQDIRAPESLSEFQAQWRTAHTNGASIFETIHRRRDGSTFPVEVSSRSVVLKNHALVQSIVRDISERKAAEEELRQVNRLQSLLLENSAVGIALVRHLAYEWVNPRMAEMLGGRVSQIQGAPISAHADMANHDQVMARIEEDIAGGGWADLECGFVRVDKSPFWARLRVKALDPANPEQGAIAIVEDITATKESEEALRQAQKMESLGILAGGIAHDFNNLLTAILGNLNLAQLQLDQEHPSQAYLANVEQTIQKASDLTRQMLAYSGKGRFIVKPNDLNRIIDEMAKLLRVSIPKKIEVVLDLAPSLPPVLSDAAQIQQVVMNLVTNAADAIGDQTGAIVIRSSQEGLDGNQVPSTQPGKFLAPGPYVRLEVEDNGCGMNPEVVARIFDPFFSTKHTGRGLGLSAMLGILRGHQAGLRIHSIPGKGSRFELFFPASSGSLEEGMPATEAAPSTVKDTRVLLVDDEPMIRETAAMVLTAMGMDVTTGADGEEALESFRTQPPDLVVLDLTMPRMDGREAFRRMRDLRPEMPIIVCSGYSEQESLQDSLGNAPSAFLPKPYSIKALERIVNEVLAAQA
ncbi:MAG: sensor histidine kinase response regulator [Holophagaceae bacterium]|nr:sensor histidine kinase response regulator [Holophagaceae bacterium]